MPQAFRVATPNLSITLHNPGPTIAPGETISGFVSRRSHIVDPEVKISVVLRGRAKSKIVVRRNKSTSTYRNRINFWGQGIGLQIHHGPVHIEKGSTEWHTWPFAIEVPRHPFSSLRQCVDPESSYLPLDNVEEHPLPSNYNFVHDSFGGSSSEGFVEYNVVAVMRDSHGHTSEAVLPFIMRQADPTPIPITDFDLRQRLRSMHDIQSQRLVPGMENAKLSFGQGLSKFFGSSKVPRFVFYLHARVPRVLQISNPNTIPFMLRAEPRWDTTSEIIQGVAQRIVVKEFKVELESITSVIAPGNLGGPRDAGDDSKLTLKRYVRPEKKDDKERAEHNGSKASEAASELPPDMDTLIVPIGDETLPSLDIGRALGLRLQRSNFIQSSIQPTFTTYCVRLAHTLSWKVVLEVAGEDCTLRGAERVTVMAPSLEQS